MVMAHGVKAKPGDGGSPKAGIGSRRIFPPQFKLQVLDSYRRDADCKGNQRATARKYGIHRRQIQKWLQAEANLRNSVVVAAVSNNNNKNSQQEPPPPPHARLSPALSPATADRPASPTRAHMPMDLSVRRASSVSVSPSPPSRSVIVPVPAAAAAAASPSQPDIWDLSKRGASGEREPPPTTKPLFKPYLLDDAARCRKAPPAAAYAYGGAEPPLYETNVDVGYVFDESGVLQPAPYLRPYHHHHHHHHRHTYPVDFKLRAIDSYYRDDCCKGNQRAVAFKYNVHRRQVQKWLKQEDDLRERVDKHLQT